MWALLDKSAHERRRQRMDLHSERLEAKLNAVDWAVRDVLVGTVRGPQQLDICRKHRFYYIPAEQLGDEAFSVRMVALYQSQYVFGPQAGVQYYGEVTKCSPVCRGDITEIRARKGTEQNLYYRFEIREWKRLNRPIAARESCFVKGLTSRFQLEHSAETPELWLRSQEEYRLCLNLRQALADTSINEADNDLGFAFRDFAVRFEGGKILVSDKGWVFAQYETADFLQNAEGVFRKLYRECVQRDSMNELSKI